MFNSRHIVAALSLAVLAQTAAFAKTASAKDGVEVHYALVLTDENPVFGEATCYFGNRCVLRKSADGIGLAVRLSKSLGQTVADLTIDCLSGCSFSGGQMHVRLRNDEVAEILRGQKTGIETLLVIKPRKPIGSVKLILAE